jgi:glycosyltransferase involved in cell wall biosynthesis
MEIFFVDGMSTDQTCEKVESYTQSSLQVKLLNNPRRYVPFALNTGIRESKGEVIIRMDAHSEYPLNYISRLVWYLYDLDAGNVGGVWNTRPANDSNKAVAIAAALSTAFGIGTPEYRLGSREIKQVDTVPYGCFRRELFDAIGMFDEDLLRNQDDEFNARIIRSGRSVYLIPDLVITYFARGEVAGPWSTSN